MGNIIHSRSLKCDRDFVETQNSSLFSLHSCSLCCSKRASCVVVTKFSSISWTKSLIEGRNLGKLIPCILVRIKTPQQKWI